MLGLLLLRFQIEPGVERAVALGHHARLHADDGDSFDCSALQFAAPLLITRPPSTPCTTVERPSDHPWVMDGQSAATANER